MSSTWTSWLLAGALAASLGWHLRGAAAVPDDAAGNCCAPELVLDDLSLSPEQRRELEQWRDTACEQSSCADGDAQAALGRLNEALRDPAILERLKQLSAEPIGGTPQATAAYMREEIERWHNVIKAANIKLD